MSARRVVLPAIALGLASAFFFTFTYVLNRAAAVDGGHWAWTAALRYLLTLPMLMLLLAWRGDAAPVLRALRRDPLPWLGWSGIGFVLFYVCLSYAAASGPAWLVAGSFQFTVIAGMLCAPLLYRDARRRVPPVALGIGLLILAGVALMQFGHFHGALSAAAWLALGCVLVGAVAYPLGNRGLLLHLERVGHTGSDHTGSKHGGGELDATQRVFGMTLASQPLWLLLAGYAWYRVGPPSVGQLWLAAGVALSAGVIATILFFRATGMVRNNPTALGAAEAMQAAEILFASMLGALFLGESWPRGWALVGAALVVLGIVAFGLVAARRSAGDVQATRVLRTDRGA